MLIVRWYSPLYSERDFLKRVRRLEDTGNEFQLFKEINDFIIENWKESELLIRRRINLLPLIDHPTFWKIVFGYEHKILIEIASRQLNFTTPERIKKIIEIHWQTNYGILKQAFQSFDTEFRKILSSLKIYFPTSR